MAQWCTLVACAMFASVAAAAEIKVLSAGAMAQSLRELLPQFEQQTGDKVIVSYGNAGVVRSRLEQGDAVDVAIMPAEGIGEAESRALIRAGTRRDVAKVDIGVAVKSGTAAPDVSTPDALRRALLAAKAVAYSDPARATSGKHFDTIVLPALGIEREVRAKAKLQTEGSAAEFVRRGEADIAVQQVTELLGVEGVTVAGLLPPALQKTTVYTAALATRAQSPDAAQKLIAFLRSPPAQAVLKAKGMEPL